jgi:hypothetical protein
MMQRGGALDHDEVERDRKECVALNDKTVAAEKALKEHQAAKPGGGNGAESAADSGEKRRLENAAKFAAPDDSGIPADLSIPQHMRRTS